MDIVSESNINRQLVATQDEIGRDKGLVMADRIKQINDTCKVHVVDEFVSKDNLGDLISNDYDYVIDCIDDFRTKAALIAYCKKHKIRILTTGGAGGQVDPSKVLQCDLSRTQHDVLLAKTRKLLRQEYGFAPVSYTHLTLPTIYSV